MDNNEFLERLVKVESQAKTNEVDIKEHEVRIKKLEDNTAILEKMDLRMGNVENNLTEIKDDLKKGKEQKRNEVG